MTLTSYYFCGNKISDYGIQNKRLDYSTLSKAFDAVLNNEVFTCFDFDEWEKISGFTDNSEEIEELQEKIDSLNPELNSEEIEELENEIYELENDYYEPDIYQWYIVSQSGANLLQEINEIVYYNDSLNMYIWGITHYGTAWDYVLTDVKIEVGE